MPTVPFIEADNADTLYKTIPVLTACIFGVIIGYNSAQEYAESDWMYLGYTEEDSVVQLFRISLLCFICYKIFYQQVVISFLIKIAFTDNHNVILKTAAQLLLRFTCTTADRLQTFDLWPRHLAGLIPVLVDSGFVYTGIGDRVACCSCEVGLKDWFTNESDPWVAHHVWSPDCAHVRKIKGPNYRPANMPPGPLNRFYSQISTFILADGTVQSISIPVPWTINDVIQERRSPAQMEIIPSEWVCVICRTEMRSILYLPCGHLVTCLSCHLRYAEDYSTCPICQVEFRAILQVSSY